jgi:TRAP-type C4-dicarboxylate transport system substrate-binding protein
MRPWKLHARWFCLLALSLLPAPDARAEQVKLTASLMVPISHPMLGAGMVRFKEEVEKSSNNTVSIEIFDKAQLFGASEVVGGVSSGAVDIGVAASYHFTSQVPAVAILDQPFLFNFSALVRAAATPGSEIRGVLDQTILANLGVRVLWWQGLGNAVFFSKGKGVADLEHLKAQRVGVNGKALAELVARCDGRPIELSFDRLYEIMKGGSLDMAMGGISAVRVFPLWEFTDTITRTQHVPAEFLLIINEKTWQSLHDAHRTAIAGAAASVELQMRERLLETEAKIAVFARSKGFKIQDLTADQVAGWRACSAGLLADYMDKNGQLAAKLMAAYGRLRTQPCCTTAPNFGGFTGR